MRARPRTRKKKLTVGASLNNSPEAQKVVEAAVAVANYFSQQQLTVEQCSHIMAILVSTRFDKEEHRKICCDNIFKYSNGYKQYFGYSIDFAIPEGTVIL